MSVVKADTVIIFLR